MKSIPNTNLLVSNIGLGTANMGVKLTEKESFDLLDAFLDFGGNLIDTARIYSDWVPGEIGRSERIIGDWLQNSKKRDNVILMTKGGHPKFESMHDSRLSLQDMRIDIELSLKALRVDVIDLYFYHRDDQSQLVEYEIETMETLRREGKIRYYGCSNWKVERILAADAYCKEKGYRGFVANQALLNLGSKNMKSLNDDTLIKLDGDLYTYHTKNPQNLAMPYTGIAGGYFHKFIKNGENAVQNSPYHTPENIQMVKHCKFLMEKYHATITQVVLGFFSQQPFQCVPLYGASSIDDLKNAMDSMEINFTAKDYIL